MTPTYLYFEIEKDNDNEEWLVQYTLESWLPDFAPTYKRSLIMSKTMFTSLYKLWIEGSNEHGKE